ncbi:hypothetical protein ACFVZ8_06580 [Streptomyces sp. NPDC059558]|uniref:hypothetical protein n=1 Tax=unclassified Streptomyces TaxID=2593676 RepID=UPI0006AD9E1A|nr:MULTISPECIES: hypothetical protein [unclassified Streptomyces]ARE72673.1 hypothetical protein B6R96_00855 [Streptomyces sp. Sge12]KOU28458.1 hypothetical protein ADK51_11670 [Streptomyces sp. WM6368]
MSDHRFTLEDAGAGLAPDTVRPPHYLHNLRYKRPTEAPRTHPEEHPPSALSDLLVVTCACGLTTPALPNHDARLAYEEHRNAIRDETA